MNRENADCLREISELQNALKDQESITSKISAGLSAPPLFPATPLKLCSLVIRK
jgi:hypothetical protein